MKSIINQKQHLGTLFQYIFELYPEDCIFVHISWVLRGIPICPLYFVDMICSIGLKLKNRGVVFQTELLQYKVATTHWFLYFSSSGNYEVKYELWNKSNLLLETILGYLTVQYSQSLPFRTVSQNGPCNQKSSRSKMRNQIHYSILIFKARTKLSK